LHGKESDGPKTKNRRKKISECLGENLRRLRVSRDLTQEDFAKLSGLSISFLQNIEYGKKWVGPNTIATLATSLDVTETELFRDCTSTNIDPAPQPDPKEILLLVTRVLGITLPATALPRAKLRKSFSAYYALYDTMPEDIGLELTRRCQEPEWDWEYFRQSLSSGGKRLRK
jgi:transcriptional regulator with XRE-family HTH domain